VKFVSGKEYTRIFRQTVNRRTLSLTSSNMVNQCKNTIHARQIRRPASQFPGGELFATSQLRRFTGHDTLAPASPMLRLLTATLTPSTELTTFCDLPAISLMQGSDI
jgi:hypothetical protein